MALGLANLTNAFDPAVFVLGGGLAEGADLYLRPDRALVPRPPVRARPAPAPALSFATLGEQAGAIGAALLAVDRLR